MRADARTWLATAPVRVGRFGDATDIGRHFLSALGRLFHIAGDFLGGRALFLDRGGDGRGDLVDLTDGLADRADAR